MRVLGKSSRYLFTTTDYDISSVDTTPNVYRTTWIPSRLENMDMFSGRHLLLIIQATTESVDIAVYWCYVFPVWHRDNVDTLKIGNLPTIICFRIVISTLVFFQYKASWPSNLNSHLFFIITFHTIISKRYSLLESNIIPLFVLIL